MTRFKKEMMKLFPYSFKEDENGDCEAYVIESEALVVFQNPCLCVILRILPNGKQKEVTDDYPSISAPYLVHLCGGDENRARQILKGNNH